MVLSALGFALMTACVKEASTYGIPVFEIVAARVVISLVLSYIDVRRKRIPIWGTHHRLLVARGVAGSVAIFCVFYAVSTLPLAEATVLQYLYPVFTAVFAVIFLKERVQRATVICVILSLIGLFVMIQPDIDTEATNALPMLSVMAGIGGALGSSAAYVLVRRLSQVEDSSVIIFYFPLVTLPIALLLLGDDFVMPGPWPLLMLILVGVFTQIGQVGLTIAMKTDSAAKASAYSYIQIIFAALIGWVYFHEIPMWTTMIGGVLIISGALVNVLGGYYFNRRLKPRDD